MGYESYFGENITIPNDTRKLDEAVARDYESVKENLIWEAARVVGLSPNDQYGRSLHSTYIDGCSTFVVCGAKPQGRASTFTLCANKYETSTGPLLDQETVTIDNFVIWKPYKNKPLRVANNLTTISRYPDEQWEVQDFVGPLIIQTEDDKVHFRQGNLYALCVPSFGSGGRPNTEITVDQTIAAKKLLSYLSALDADSMHMDAYF